MCHNTDTIYILTTECIFKPHHQSMHKILTLILERNLRYHQWATTATQCVEEEFLLWNLHPTLTSNLYRNFGVKILYESRVTTWVPQKRHNMNIFTDNNRLASLPIYLQILVSLSRTNPQKPLVGHNSDTMCQGRIFTLESTSNTH